MSTSDDDKKQILLSTRASYWRSLSEGLQHLLEIAEAPLATMSRKELVGTGDEAPPQGGKGEAANAVTSTEIANATITLGNIAQNGCTDTQIMKWNNGASAWQCTPDVDTDTTYDGTDFALSNQNCSAGPPRASAVAGSARRNYSRGARIGRIQSAEGAVPTDRSTVRNR